MSKSAQELLKKLKIAYKNIAIYEQALLTLLVGMQTSTATMENSVEIP